jgi:hypothetical protein
MLQVHGLMQPHRSREAGSNNGKGTGTDKEDVMKKKPIQKLTLSRETLLHLESGDLEKAAAGRLTDFVTCYITCLRTCRCTVA